MIGGSSTIDDLVNCSQPDVLDALSDVELVRLADTVVTFWPCLDAARLRIVAAVDARQAFKVDGARDAASWLAWKAGDRRGAARREVDLAAAVAAMPAVDEALAAGSLSKAKAVELGRAAAADPDQQEQLVVQAKSLSVEQVAKAVDRWELEHRPDTVEVRETLTVTPTPGGGRLEATLDSEHLEWVQVAIDTATDTLGLHELAWDQRRAHGLVAIARHYLDHAHVPVKRQGRPTVVVTLDADTLAATTGGTARLDSGSYITGDRARRLACDAAIIRLISGPDSMPLDVGRATRSISPAQARAVIHRDHHCRYQGCTAPPWACEVHHRTPWAQGGPTDLDHLVLVCWYHHRLTHRSEHTHQLVDTDDGRLALEPKRRTAHPDAA